MDEITIAINKKYDHSSVILFGLKQNFEIVKCFNELRLQDNFVSDLYDRNLFIKKSVINAFRLLLLDLSKLFNDKLSREEPVEKFNIIHSINKLFNYSDSKYHIEIDSFECILKRISEKQSSIKHLITLRDKVIAHSDINFLNFENDLTIGEIQELILIASDYHELIKCHLISKNIHLKIFFEDNLTSYCKKSIEIFKYFYN